MLTPTERRLFDETLEQVLAVLPAHLHELLEVVPLVVEDFPSEVVLRDLGMDEDDDGSGVCGLHWGVALTRRSVDQSGRLPDQMMIFREPILAMVGHGQVRLALDRLPELSRQIRITILHEIGHHLGLDEEDLQALGYG